MSYTQALILGIVQGLTEFLPVSSSGHLILVPYVFGWPDQGLAFDAAIHLGTLGALLAYFRVELTELVTGALARRLAVLLAVASIPALVVGWLTNDWIETYLRSPLVIAAATAFWAIAMWWADRRAVEPPAAVGDPLAHVGWGPGVAIGCAQTLALVPGTSRSGITITAGLLGRLDRATAARFSFMLGLPVTGAAGAYKMLQLVRGGVPVDTGPLLLAVLAAFLSGWFAVWFLVTYLKRRSLLPFVVYRLILAALILLVVLRG